MRLGITVGTVAGMFALLAAPASAAPLKPRSPQLALSGERAVISVKLPRRAKVAFALCPKRACRANVLKVGAKRGRGTVRRTFTVPDRARGKSWFARACVKRRCAVSRRATAFPALHAPPSGPPAAGGTPAGAAPSTPQAPTQQALATALGSDECATRATNLGEACVPTAAPEDFARAQVLRVAQTLPEDLRPTAEELAGLTPEVVAGPRSGARAATRRVASIADDRVVKLTAHMFKPPSIERCPDAMGVVRGRGDGVIRYTLSVIDPEGTGIAQVEFSTHGVLASAQVGDDARFAHIDYQAGLSLHATGTVIRPTGEATSMFAMQIDDVGLNDFPRQPLPFQLFSKIKGQISDKGLVAFQVPVLLHLQLVGQLLAFGEAAVTRTIAAFDERERDSWYAGGCLQAELTRGETSPSRGGEVTESFTLTPPDGGLVEATWEAFADNRATGDPTPDPCPGSVSPAKGAWPGTSSLTVTDTDSEWGSGCVSLVAVSRRGRALAFDAWDASIPLTLRLSSGNLYEHVWAQCSTGGRFAEATSIELKTAAPVNLVPGVAVAVKGTGTRTDTTHRSSTGELDEETLSETALSGEPFATATLSKGADPVVTVRWKTFASWTDAEIESTFPLSAIQEQDQFAPAGRDWSEGVPDEPCDEQIGGTEGWEKRREWNGTLIVGSG